MGAFDKQIAELIKVWRLYYGLSQGKLAARTGIHRNQIGEYERGATVPSPSQIGRIIDGLDLTPVTFLPTPPCRLALPRRAMLRPATVRLPVKWHTLDITYSCITSAKLNCQCRLSTCPAGRARNTLFYPTLDRLQAQPEPEPQKSPFSLLSQVRRSL